jgi:inhibitor of KinA
MKIKPYGENGLLVQWEDKIDPKINGEVHQLNRLIQEAGFNGLSYTVPAYCSLTIVFAKPDFDWREVSETIHTLYENISPVYENPGRKLRIPVCYARSYALDQDEVRRATGLSWNAFTEKHYQKTYQVYMLGFLPGFS